MSYTVGEKRRQTMLKRIGTDAAELIDNQKYLPFYRSIQLKLERMGKGEEWVKMIAAAKAVGIKNPKWYFAKLCKRVKDGTYHFAEKVAAIASDVKLYLSDKLVRFGFGDYLKYWVHKADEYIKMNSQADFVELLEYAERKNVTQKYFAKALLNGKSPRQYYTDNILGGAKS